MAQLTIKACIIFCIIHLSVYSFWGDFNFAPEQKYYSILGLHPSQNITLPSLKKTYISKIMGARANNQPEGDINNAYDKIKEYLENANTYKNPQPNIDNAEYEAASWLQENPEIKNITFNYFKDKTPSEIFYTEQAWLDILQQDDKAYQTYFGSWQKKGLSIQVAEKVKGLIRKQIENQKLDKFTTEKEATIIVIQALDLATCL